MQDKNYESIDEALKALTQKDFLKLGLNEVAYIKEEIVNGKMAFVIHAADGTPLSAMDNEDIAHDALSFNDLESVTVH